MVGDWARSVDRVGRRDQVVEVLPAVLTEGQARGLRVLDVRIAGGLDVRLVLDRAMDIAAARFRGTPIAWRSPSGDVDPRLVPDHDWTRGFTGGLLTTCGLRNIGSSVEIDGVLEPAMGRMANQPAYDVNWRVEEDAAGPVVEVTGLIDELSVLRYHLQVARRVTVSASPASVRVRDTVTNLGSTPQHVMVLYHCNLGWPLVDEHATVDTTADFIRAHTPEAVGCEGEASRLRAPHVAEESRVFQHVWRETGTRRAAGLWNPAAALHGGPLGVTVSADAGTLPHLFQWTLLRPRNYVVGLEPANSSGHGYEAARDSGGLYMLSPGMSETFEVDIRVHEDEERFRGALSDGIGRVEYLDQTVD